MAYAETRPTLADTDLSYDDFEALLETAEGNASRIWEMRFVENLQSNFLRYGTKMFLSHRQREVLEGLVYGGADHG